MMRSRASHAAPRMALAGAALAGLVGMTGAAAENSVPLGLIALGASAATFGLTRRAPRTTRARYEKSHKPLAGPRPGARLG